MEVIKIYILGMTVISVAVFQCSAFYDPMESMLSSV